jgi:DNA-binding MarR family transcriptional regulator
MPKAAAPNKRTRAARFDAQLESPRLRQVLDHFGDVEKPVHMVAASAIFRASKIVSSRMEAALSELNLTPARYELLGLLDNTEGGRMSLRDLSRATLHHPATMTYTIDTLEKRKLIRRKPDPSDRRAVLAEVTAAGRELVVRASRVLEAIDWGVGDYSETQAADVAVLLSMLHPA